MFIASEGNFYAIDGSIDIFRGDSSIQTINNVGDVVQSIIIYEDDLFVYQIMATLLKNMILLKCSYSLPCLKSPQIIQDLVKCASLIINYILLNWLTKDIKVLDLYNYTIKNFLRCLTSLIIIVTDGSYLYVSTPHKELYDNQGSSVMKVDITDGNIVDTYEVGLGPEQLYLDGNLLHV